VQIGNKTYVIDVLTIVDEHVNFDEVEKTIVTHKIPDAIDIKMVPYDFLIDLKLDRDGI